MTTPSVPFATWILAGFDPIILIVAVWLGWKADQPGKIFIAAIAALGIALVADWLLTLIGVPLLAPLARTEPTLLPVRSVAAFVWAAAAYLVRETIRPAR